MAVANAPGYPDFQDAPNLRGQLLVNSAINIPNAIPNQIFKGTTLQFGHTWLCIGVTTGYFTLIVRYYDPFTSTLAIFEHRFVCAAGITNMILPNILSGLELDVFGSSIGGGENTFMSLGFTNSYNDGYHWFNPPNEAKATNIVLGAGASSEAALPYVQPGPAQAWFNSSDTAGSVVGIIGTLDTNGAHATQLCEVDPIPFTQNVAVRLPAAPCYIRMLNLTGVNVTVSYALNATGDLG